MSETGIVTTSIFQSKVLLPFARAGADPCVNVLSGRGPEFALAFFDCLRDDLGDLFGGPEIGGELVLRQGPGDARCGVGARETPADAPYPEHAPGLLRVCSQAADGVAERPGGREPHDLVYTTERPGGYLPQPLGRD